MNKYKSHLKKIIYTIRKKLQYANVHKNVIIFVLGLFIAGCSVKRQVENEETTHRELPVIKVFSKDTVLHHEYVADIQAVQNVELRARVQGFLEKVYVDEGQEVKKASFYSKQMMRNIKRN